MVNIESDGKNGLYTPQYESDACGTGLYVNLDNKASNSIVDKALNMLERMEHRGACGCEPESGDGAGISLHLPHVFYKKQSVEGNLGFFLPDKGSYGTGLFFLPKNRLAQDSIKIEFQQAADQLGFQLIGYRKVPVNSQILGPSSASTEPYIIQPFFATPQVGLTPKQLDRKLYLLRKLIDKNVKTVLPQHAHNFYCCSLSSRIIVYKGQLTSLQVRSYYPDLSDEFFMSAIALVHSRFATNTVPRWQLAQPFRCISHNGEINTVQGNINWWRSREKMLQEGIFTKTELDILLPIIEEEISDSGTFDNILEFLTHAGRTLPHVLMMMIPEAWQNDREIGQLKKDFYAYHEMLMEPWDGPASMTFTDGTLVGATLDRNGLRPSRYIITRNNELILASETGVIDIPADQIVKKDRLEPGKILIVDLDEGRIIEDEELKKKVCSRQDYNKWLAKDTFHVNELPIVLPGDIKAEPLRTRQLAHGLTQEDRELVLRNMSAMAKEPIGSMGTDTPLAVLSRFAQHIANYFRQNFAQVTNPPIDPLRESDFMTLKTIVGKNKSLLDHEKSQVIGIRLDSPIIGVDEYFRLRFNSLPDYKVAKVDLKFTATYTDGALKEAIEQVCEEVEQVIEAGATLVFLSNHHISSNWMPIPSLLATGAVHHRLVEKGIRRKASIIVNASDAIETHHFATLLSYGADAIYPRLAYETIQELALERYSGPETLLFQSNYRHAVEKGLLKVMSKLGISTVLSYKGAQTFEALGISKEVIDFCFKGTLSRISGVGFDLLAQEAIVKHRIAYPKSNGENLALKKAHLASLKTKSVLAKASQNKLHDLGMYQWRRKGEYHLFNPTSIHLLQHAAKTNSIDTYRKYAKEINKQQKHHVTLRSLLDFKPQQAIPITEVEPVEVILKRFATGAMSFGSISYEAHTTLAIAMNRIGGRSNSGEGGEDDRRYNTLPNGDSMRSATKQVASGRFGVTSYYLTNADEIQIKMAQGAKPGEGGQLPGGKVDDWIGRVRHSTPGVGLISPPPHHDIYSIEDLAQLIFDLKNANQDAAISVKLVSKAGVGIIASGVTKGHADHILISGHDGGTGASPVSSIQHAGLPWELGLAEAHQTLLKNKLRGRVRLQVDGQIRTGRDLAIATLLGAEEWGIATAALVVEGCILMRKCHLNTCPVGIATQDKDLRKKFEGKVNHLVNFFHFLAEDMREHMAMLGFRTVDEMVGQSQVLQQHNSSLHKKAASVDLAALLFQANTEKQAAYKCEEQDHGLGNVLDRDLIKKAAPAFQYQTKVHATFNILNTDRAVGAMLSHEVSKSFGKHGLPKGTIDFRFRGSAGQSFGAFLAKGINLTVEGDTNDYFGKGLSGGGIVVVPDRDSTFDPSLNIIVGNVGLYGATAGEVYIRGKAGERFAVRNSGATAVVEGVGAHGCEYMTGGTLVILGEIGRNFAAGMSGGVAYLLNPHEELDRYCNTGMVNLERPDQDDLEIILKLLNDHFKYTGSTKALGLMQNWKKASAEFIKVMPREYKKVLAAQRKNAAETANGFTVNPQTEESNVA